MLDGGDAGVDVEALLDPTLLVDILQVEAALVQHALGYLEVEESETKLAGDERGGILFITFRIKVNRE